MLLGAHRIVKDKVIRYYSKDMGLVEKAERCARDVSRVVVPAPVREHLYLFYMSTKRILVTRSFDLPLSVQIEINTHCNRSCSYCSNSKFPKRPEYMDESLYRGIIDELAEINYRGRIAPHNFSEPLLHPELTNFMAYARKKVKRAELVIYTNGDFLDREKFDELKRAGVNKFIITQHGQKIPQSLSGLLNSLTSAEWKDVISHKLDGFRLFNRGIPGLITTKRRRAIPNPCFHADCHLQVLVNGDVNQCCNAFSEENIFGNARINSLIDIWRSPTFQKFRKEVSHGQFNLDVCKRCIYDKGEIVTVPQESLSVRTS